VTEHLQKNDNGFRYTQVLNRTYGKEKI